MSEETLEKILEAARRVFARHGYDAPLRLIAAEAGVAKSLIVWYFGSKWGLVRRIALESLPGDIAQRCLSQGLRGNSLARCLIQGFMEKYSSDESRRLLVETMALSVWNEEVAEEVARFCSDVIGRLAEGIYGSDTPENRVRVRILFGGLMCYALNKPKCASPQLYAEVLEKVAGCQI